ncbi:MAG: cation diffusion facilitator family transporter [Phycisphaerales bacterium]
MSDSQLKANTLLGLVASVLLAIAKFVAGVLGHSSALVADAVESLADTVGSIVVWQGLRVAAKPPDEDHPYGYGKAEALAALVVGFLLLLAAIGIVYKALAEIITVHQPPATWTLWVLVAVVVVKEALYRRVIQAAEQSSSEAARADAWHHRSDAITSGAALVGVAVAIYGPRWLGIPGLVLADEAAAMIASGIIAMTALSIMKDPLGELLDRASKDTAAKVRAVAEGVEGVVRVEKLFARKSGRGYHVEMHLHVPPEMPVRDAHALAGKVKAEVKAGVRSVQHMIVHVEPAEH